MRISDWSSDVCSSDLLGMLAHGEIVVGAPDGDRLRPVMAVEATGVGEGALVAQDVDEHPIATFAMAPVDRLREDMLVVHLNAQSLFPHPLFRGAFIRCFGLLPVITARSLRENYLSH